MAASKASLLMKLEGNATSTNSKRNMYRKATLDCTVLRGNNVFISLPNGYSKMMIAALLPHAFNCILGQPDPSNVICCVSPLISLTLDQRTRLLKLGLSTETTCSTD